MRRPARLDRALGALSWASALLVAIAFAWIAGDLLAGGWERLSADFLWAAPRDAGRGGGVGPMLAATVWILAVCVGAAAPVGLGTAVLLAEITVEDGPLARAVRASLDVLAGVPSIVFGLFGNAFFCQVLGLGFSVLSGGLTLACMVLPLLIRFAEEGLRAIPPEQRRAAAALGLSRATTLRWVLLPAAAPALAAGLALGVGRAMAETAALLFTSGSVDRAPRSAFDAGRALSVHVYELAANVPGGEASARATALVLLALVSLANLGAAALGLRWLRARRSFS
ncbi:MAG: phosphate ABC transporter permease PstA [Planctomycetota bacterium]|nr:MAG: phosphate ABC transporter permease PstA [Planctomycetota bacterium]